MITSVNPGVSITVNIDTLRGIVLMLVEAH